MKTDTHISLQASCIMGYYISISNLSHGRKSPPVVYTTISHVGHVVQQGESILRKNLCAVVMVSLFASLMVKMVAVEGDFTVAGEPDKGAMEM